MIQKKLEVYGDLTLCNIRTDECTDINSEGCSYVRIETSPTEEMQHFYEKSGFFHADRMIKASINLKRADTGLSKRIRHEVIKTADYKEEIRKIALHSFPADRRFHVSYECNQEIAAKIISGWVNEADESYVCLFKDEAAGFAVVDQESDGIYEIKLAAVNEKYRLSGAAVSLYSYLIKEAQNAGGKQLFGYISSVNMPVMNLYASLGAVFSDPKDIFLKTMD